MHKLLLSILFLFLLPKIHAQTCQYLAYEGFNYANNLPLNGQFGGVGWALPWDIQNGNNTVPGFQSSTTNPLIYGNLLLSGNHGSGGFNYLSAGRRLNLSGNGPFASYLNGAGMIGQSGTTLYWSVLLRKEFNNNQFAAVMLQGGNNTPWVTNQNPRVALGYFSTQSTISGTRYWGLAANGTVYNSTIPVSAGSTTLLVMQIDFGTSNHTLHLWVNPSSIGGVAPAANIVQTISGNLQLHSLAMYLGDFAGQSSVDEIRVGSSYACVTPDNMTVINVPPTASFTMTPSQGIAPMAISFDGSASADPDGPLVHYIWNYMDGSLPDTTTAPFTSHTYTYQGQYAVSLAVTDNGGLQHTAYQPLTITNANGNFPCQTAVRSLQLASCGMSNGSFLVMPPAGANYTLHNASNSVVVLSAIPDTYQGLAAGNYSLYVNSAAGCTDTLSLMIETDSSTCPGWTPASCLNLGMNLDYVNYYDRQRMFKNFFKDASDWITYNATSPTPWTVWNTGVFNQIPMDPNGYPTQIPFNTSIGLQGVRVSLSANDHILPGSYSLWYDGTGTIEVLGVIINQSQAGRIDFTVPQNAGNIYLNIPYSSASDHLRNFRVLRPGDELTSQAQPFYQSFLNKLSPFHTIRFLEATATNSSDFQPVNWSERAQHNYYSEGTYRGLSYETIIDLCNKLQRNVWINIPHSASNDYIQQMAMLFRDRLDPNLQVYVEYSNEVWNWQFPQAHFVSDNGPQNISYPRRYAERCRNVFAIWSQVFSGQMNRLHRVMNTQYGNNFYGEQILAHLKNNEYDEISPSWYFGYSGTPCAAGFNSSTTAQDIIDCTRQVFIQSFPSLRLEYRNASLFGKKIIHYEGGQHMADIGALTPWLPALWAAQLHPDLYNLYNQVLDSLKRLKPALSCAYNLARMNETQFGSFGHINDIDDIPSMSNAPKWMALMNSNCLSPSVLEIKCFLQGYYNGGNLMQTVRYNQGSINDTQSTQTDWVTVELHQANTPFQSIYSFNGIIHTNGIIRCPIPASLNGQSFYIVLKHRNSVETWSSLPVVLSSFTSYDFTISMNQAYGNNLVEVESGTWSFFAGDLNNDENVDLLDATLIETDITNFSFGNVATDINGDGNVDLLDAPLTEINIRDFIYAIHP